MLKRTGMTLILMATAVGAEAAGFSLTSTDIRPRATIKDAQVFNGFGCSGAGKADGSGLPAGAVQINTDFGGPGWGGPCPPVGDTPHRYHFTLHALKVDKLELPPGATAALAGYMINANSIGKAKLTGLYGRKK